MNQTSYTKKIALGVVAVFAVLILFFALAAAGKTFSRHQKLADANNRVKVTQINIRNSEQQAKVVAAQDGIIKAKADQRLIEAKGIRAAQDEISATLTDKYLQHEAIKAQLAMANSPNHTQVYIPSGNNGIPLVKTTP